MILCIAQSKFNVELQLIPGDPKMRRWLSFPADAKVAEVVIKLKASPAHPLLHSLV